MCDTEQSMKYQLENQTRGDCVEYSQKADKIAMTLGIPVGSRIGMDTSKNERVRYRYWYQWNGKVF